jgi:hypothetical protein
MYAVFVLPALVMVYRALTGRRKITYIYALTLYCTAFSFIGSFPLGLTLANTLAAMAVGFELVSAIYTGRRVAAFNLLDLGVGVLLLWMFLNTAVHGQATDGLRHAIVLAMIVLATKLRPHADGDDLRIFMTALTVAACVVAFSMWIQSSISPTLFGLHDREKVVRSFAMLRLTGIIRNPNGTAYFLLVGIAGACGGLAWPHGVSNRMRSAVETSLILVLGWAMLYTQSRAGLLALLVVVLIHLRASLRIPMSVFGLMILAIVTALVSGYLEGMADFLDQAVFADRPTMSSADRGNRLMLALEVMAESPWFGDTSVELKHVRMHYHNAMLQFGADNGIIAALGFLVMLLAVSFGSLGWSLRDGANTVSTAALCFAMGGIMMDLFHDVLSSSISYWLVMGFVVNAMGARHPTEEFGGPSSPSPAPLE